MAHTRSKTDETSSDDDNNQDLGSNGSENSTRIPRDTDAPGSRFLDSLCIFRMMHENRNEDGKQLSGEQRLKYIERLQESYKTIDSSLSFKDYIIRSSKVRWTSFEDDMKFWELYDRKEDFLRKIKEKKGSREIRRDNRSRSSSRSRSRSRSRDRNHNYNKRDRRRDRRDRGRNEREELGDIDGNQKEKVM